MGLADRALALAGRQEVRYSADTWLSDYLLPSMEQFVYGGNTYGAGAYGLRQTMVGIRAQEISQSLPGYSAALRHCPPAFAAQMVRALVISQARFTFRNLPSSKTPRKTFGTRALSVLEHPAPAVTTGEMLARMEWHAGLAGNAYVYRQPKRLRVLRPDWVVVIFGSDQEPEDAAHALDGELIGFVYCNGGFGSGNRPQTLLPDDVAHWCPLPDPEMSHIGMSWITPAVREIQNDRAASEHKLRYWTQGATPNLVVKGIPALTKPQFDEIVDAMDARHNGVMNAFKCLHPETEVSMWNGTRRRADEVMAGDTVVSWADGRAVPGTVSVADWQPPTAIVTVRTQRGRVIKTNHHHPFLLRDGTWVNAIDLNRGDLLVTGLGWANDDVEDALTPYQAWVLGSIVGDGSTVADTPVISAWDPGVRARLAIGHRLTHTGKGHDYRVLGIRALCVETGIMYKRSYEKRVPPQVLTGSAKVRAGFIAGLIDADGAVADPAMRRSMDLSITSTSKELLVDVQHMLASLGVNASLSLAPSLTKGAPGGSLQGEGPRIRDAWRLIILGNDQARQLVQHLDLACEAKAARLATYAATPSRQDRSRVDRVESVEVGPAEPTIGLEIADHHTHVTGGVVTHNTLYLTAGADATVIGNNFKDMDLKNVIAGGETRIAALSRVPAPILGISEGLAGSSLNAGNFGMARRLFADTWVYPTLQDLSGSLADIVDVPNDAELWFDTTDMPLLREDAKDAAEILNLKISGVTMAVRDGFTAESSIAAAVAGDVSLLKHSGLTSVQLQPPGSGLEEADPTADGISAGIDKFLGGGEGTRARFDPADHPRNPKGSAGGGRFRSVAQRVVDALQEWSRTDRKGDPFAEFTDREPLRKVAAARGIKLRRGASRDEIAEALKADLLEHVGDDKVLPDKPAPKKAPAKKAAPEAPEVDLSTLDDPEALRDALDLRKVPELKDMLREAGLPVSGRKRELVDRLVEHQSGGREEPDEADQLGAIVADLYADPSGAHERLVALPVGNLRALAEHLGMSEKLSGTKSDMAYRILWRLETGGGVSLAGQSTLLGTKSSGLTGAQKAALTRWASTDTVPARINEGLRAGSPVTPEVARLDEAMAASQTSQDVVLYRGIRNATTSLGLRGRLPDDLVGHEWTEPGFSSTTQRRGIAEVFSSGDDAVLFEIHVPAGTHAARLPGGEDEVLLDRGLKFRVIGDRTQTTMVGLRGDEPLHKRVLEVEVVPDTAAPPAEAKARSRQAQIDAKRTVADGVGEVLELLDNGVSPTALRHRISASGLDDASKAKLLTAVDEARAVEVENRIREAYRKAFAAANAGDNRRSGLIPLADIRDHLPDLDRAEVDAVLTRMARTGGARLTPNEDRKRRTARDRDAALRIPGYGSEDANDWLTIDDPSPLLAAVDEPDGLKGAAKSLAADAGLTQVGEHGTPLSYDPKQHTFVGDQPRPGQKVAVIRPGYVAIIDGEPVVVNKATVETWDDSLHGPATPARETAPQSVPAPRPTRSGQTVEGEAALSVPTRNLAAMTESGDPRADSLWYRTGDNSLETGTSRPGAFDMADQMRSGRLDPAMRRRVADIASVMAESPLPSPILVYRGVEPERVRGLGRVGEGRLVGKQFTDKSFVSATTDAEHASWFGGTVMRITAPRGVGAIRMADRAGTERDSQESEILLDRGLRYRVVREYGRGELKGPWGGAYVLDVEVVP